MTYIATGMVIHVGSVKNLAKNSYWCRFSVYAGCQEKGANGQSGGCNSSKQTNLLMRTVSKLSRRKETS